MAHYFPGDGRMHYGQVLHGCATTTEAVRRAIENSPESLRRDRHQFGVIGYFQKRTDVKLHFQMPV
jgi:hypothetical protein